MPTDAPFKPIDDAVKKGLDQVAALKAGGGWVDFNGGVSSQLGAFARAEVGWKPREDLDLFGFAEASTLQGVEAGAGLRWHF